MGRDKALLEVEPGKTLLSRAVENLRSLGIRSVRVSGIYEGFDCIADDLFFRGPLAGIRATSRAPGRILFVPVDMPGITKNLIQRLAETPADAVYFEGFPLPAMLSGGERLEAAFARLMQPELQERDRSVMRLLQEMNAVALPVLDLPLECFQNLNSPTDWHTFVEV